MELILHMKVGIIGGGFTALAAGYYLTKAGIQTHLFEKENAVGGLAIGYKEKKWKWSLEQHYHHWFTNDHAILSLAHDISYPVHTTIPHTNLYVHEKIYRFDSPLAALSFPLLTPIERLRMLSTLAFFRFNPFWQPLEKYNATQILPAMMGTNAYKLLWEPLFINKFGEYAHDISLAWFWARIKKRTQSLASSRRISRICRRIST